MNVVPPEYESCCSNECCAGPCCEGTCCASGDTCCNGECCSDICCAGQCCPAGNICCGGQCCAAICCGGQCCDGICCNGACCNEVCCAGVCCPGGGTCSTQGTIVVDEGVDLSFGSVSDEAEADPGGFLCVNDDDDNDNDVPDKDETGPTSGEDDLQTLTISLNVRMAGTVTLSCQAGCGHVKLYENADRSNPVTLPKSWDETQLPETLYVEGYETSATARDVTLEARYEGDGGPCEDVVKLTVIEVDLQIHNGGSDLDHGDETGSEGELVSEEDEEEVGAYILVNWDDDDGDGAMNADGSWSADPLPDTYETSVENEDNLAQLIPSVDPLPDAGIVELETTGYDSQVRAWSASTKQSEINLGGYPWTFNLANPVQRAQLQQIAADGIWIEGYAASDEDRDVVFVLRYKDATGQELCSDTVKATVVMVNLGNAVHREGQIAGISGRGHAALVWRFLGPLTKENIEDDEKFLVIHMQGGGVVDNHNLTMMTQSPGEEAWGCFTHPLITYSQRLMVLQAAKSLVATGVGYTAANTALGNNNEEEEEKDWDGKLNTIDELRCDGLVEVCYEINGVEVWGMVRIPDNQTVHYDITYYNDEWTYHEVMGGWDHEPNGLPDNLEEHNDFDGIGDWDDTLMPATQCGHAVPEDADTRFQAQDLCMPVGSNGGN